MLSSEDVLFCGLGDSVVSWYRTGAVAFALGCDWIGIRGEPGDLRLQTALKRGGVSIPDFEDYKIVVLQQVWGSRWVERILELRHQGVTVLYEVDDCLHAVRKIPGHPGAIHFTKERMKEYERAMKVCDGMIVSTEWLAHRYRIFNRNTHVCLNGIDLPRYDRLSKPNRGTINIGWAGGAGHDHAVRAWLPAIARIMEEYREVNFVTIGLPLAELLAPKFPMRTLTLPQVSVENFPGILTNFDIAIAPAGRNNFYLAKSNLRWLEASALKIPTVADSVVYPDIVPGETGFHADTAQEAYFFLKDLVEDATLRRRVGAQAYDYVAAHHSLDKAIEQWEEVFVAQAAAVVS